MEIAQVHEKEQVLIEIWAELGQKIGAFSEEFRPELTGWLAVVREELGKNSPNIRKLAEAIHLPYWRSSAPDWWPTGMQWP